MTIFPSPTGFLLPDDTSFSSEIHDVLVTQISWRSLSCFGFAGYKVASFSMTYFERRLYHRERVNCLRHDEGKKCMRSQ